MRFFLASLFISAAAFAQDAGLAELATKLGQQLTSRQVRSVAVLRFTNTQNYDSQLSAFLTDRLNRALVTSVQGIEVASRTQSEGMLRELRLADVPELGTKDLQTVASRLAVNAVIVGTFNVTAQSVSLDTTIIDGASAHIIGGDSAKLPRADVDQYLVERKGPPPSPSLSIPSGTIIDVKLNEKVDAATARNGRTVSAALVSNISVGNVIVARKGAEVKVQATTPDGMELHLALASVTLADQHAATASSEPIVKPATTSHGRNFGGVLSGGSIGVPPSSAGQMKPAEAAKDSQLSFHLNQDAR